MGFSTVWQSLTTEVPRALTQAACYCARNPFPRVLYPVLLLVHSVRLPVCLYILTLETVSSSSHTQVHRYSILNITKSPFLDKINYPYVPFLGSPFVYLLEHPSTPTSGTLPTKQQHNRYFVSTPFISSTHHCLSLLIAFNTLFLSRFSLFSPVVDVIHL